MNIRSIIAAFATTALLGVNSVFAQTPTTYWSANAANTLDLSGSTILTLLNWKECESLGMARLSGMERHYLTNGDMPSSNKRFFKVKAVKD